MILETRDARRIYRLLDDFIQYAGEMLGWGEVLSSWADGSGSNFVETAYEAMNCERREEIVESYVRDRAGEISRRDLRQVEMWRYGLAGEFGLVRVGDETYMTFEDNVFRVRGIMQEIDSFADRLPQIMSVALIPFEDTITYCLGCHPYYHAVPEGLFGQEELVRKAIRSQKVIRSPYQFIKASIEIHAAHADDVDKKGRKGRTGKEEMTLRFF